MEEEIFKKDKNEEKNQEDRFLGVGSFILEIIKVVFLAFIIIVPIRIFLFQPFFVQGASMEPNFEDGQYLIINELGYKETNLGSLYTVKSFKEISRQEVVVFRYPIDPSKFFIKRVIGLPGEKVEIKDGQVKIYNSSNPNGFALDESGYLSKSVKTSGNSVINLKNDEYFVMGDNRMFSSDSRSWGPIKEKHMIGKVLLRAWPVNKIGFFR